MPWTRCGSPNNGGDRSSRTRFDFVVIIDRDYRFQFVNHTAAGVTEEDLIGKATPFEFVDERHHEEMKRVIDRAFEGEPGEYEAYTPLLGAWFLSFVGPLRQGGAE